MKLTILSVASEIYPLVKTGGLADVAGALPKALLAENVRVVTLVPGYPAVMQALRGAKVLMEEAGQIGRSVRLLSGSAAGHDLFVLDAPHFFGREGNPYLGPDGRDWPDNGERFAALAQMAAKLGRGCVAGFQPDLIQGHDWQAALVPAYLHYGDASGPPFVLTIHNLAFQGRFPPSLLHRIGLPDRAMAINALEYYGDISFLKGGIRFADRINTVSPSYAEQIITDEGGMGLGGMLRTRADQLVGILNGIDTDEWNPASDTHIEKTFDINSFDQKVRNKLSLQRELGLDARPDVPIFAVISRLTAQKGLDLLAGLLPALSDVDVQFAILGTGDANIEEAFAAASWRQPRQIACALSYDEQLAHRIQAGADALIIPSRFEPCGLTQFCAMRYGTLPIAARTGGLADSVIDANIAALRASAGTGFLFSPVEREPLLRAIHRALEAYAMPNLWAKLQANAMRLDFGWAESARSYAGLFRQLVEVARRRSE